MVEVALLLEVLWIIAQALCYIPFVGHVLYYYVAKDYIYPWFAAQTGLKWSILLTAVLAFNVIEGLIITTESTIDLLNKAGFRL